MFRRKNKEMRMLLDAIERLDDLCPNNSFDIITDKNNSFIACGVLDDNGNLRNFVFEQGLSISNSYKLEELIELVLKIRNKYKHGKQRTTEED